MKKNFRKIDVKTWHMRYDGVGKIGTPRKNLEVVVWNPKSNQDYLDNYQLIGKQYGWTGRLLLSTEELSKIIHSESHQFFFLKLNGNIAGYFEIEIQENEVEIVYLGLKEEYIGKGLGKQLIHSAIDKGLEFSKNVWLHTCEYDHPNAIKAYKACGFKIEKETIEEEYYPIDFKN